MGNILNSSFEWAFEGYYRDDVEKAKYLLPQSMREELNALIFSYEKQTGQIYEITVHTVGSVGNYDQIFGTAKSRASIVNIEVYDGLDKYSVLDGIYTDIDALQNKIKECGFESPYIRNYEIYYSFGGSISIPQTVAKYRYVDKDFAEDTTSN